MEFQSEGEELKETLEKAPSKRARILLSNNQIWFVQYDLFEKEKRLWVTRAPFLSGTADTEDFQKITVIGQTGVLAPIRWVIDNDNGDAYDFIIETITTKHHPKPKIVGIKGV